MSNIGETGSNRNRPEHRIQSSDPGSPLTNLSVVHARMDSLQQFLSESISSNTLISKNQMDMVSSEISSAIHQIIINGAALLAASNPLPAPPPQAPSVSDPKHPDNFSEKTIQISDDGDEKSEYEVVQLDAVELLAEHIHFCDICGKGFKRDANLRMHMRAHGNEYKTAEALTKPDKSESESGRERRFSCPFEGCNRNKKHGKFRALKSVTCVKNHFKRSHCPKTYRCERCNKKSFSVVSDLKSHYKQCGGGGGGGGGGESRWRCSCGTTFSRKDKLFGHVALFEGHMPLVEEKMKDEDDHDRDGDGNDGKDNAVVEVEEEENHKDSQVGDGMDLDDGFFQGLLDDFGSTENYCLQDVFGSPNKNESPRWNGEFL